MKFPPQKLLRLYRNMERGRRFNEAIVELCRMADLPRMWSSGVGMEGIEAGAGSFLKHDDWIWSTQRSITACLAKGLDPKVWLRNNLSRMSDHHIRTNRNAFSSSSEENSPEQRNNPAFHLEDLFNFQPIADNGTGRVLIYLFGDSSVRSNEVVSWIEESCKDKLPIVWVLVEKQGSPLFTAADVGSCISKEISSNGHNMLEMSVGGRDAVAVARTVLSAVNRARRGIGPSLIKAKLSNAIGNPNNSIVNRYRAFENDRNQDPITEMREALLNRRAATLQELHVLEAKIAKEVSEVFKWAVKNFVH